MIHWSCSRHCQTCLTLYCFPCKDRQGFEGPLSVASEEVKDSALPGFVCCKFILCLDGNKPLVGFLESLAKMLFWSFDRALTTRKPKRLRKEETSCSFVGLPLLDFWRHERTTQRNFSIKDFQNRFVRCLAMPTANHVQPFHPWHRCRRYVFARGADFQSCSSLRHFACR